jgi:5-methylcytosine-specific restriction protein A
MTIPRTTISREHILSALDQIRQSGYPARREATGFDLLFDGHTYPPKYVVALANKFATGKLLRKFSGGEETNGFLQSHGFTIVPRPHKNPPWSRDELILALDLYVRHNPVKISKTHPEVIELSRVLNVLGGRLNRRVDEKYRNANGVYMKLCNFLRFDPEYKGSGLKAGGVLEESVWNEFAHDPRLLAATAKAIRSVIATPPTNEEIELELVGGDEEFPEGAILRRARQARERNRNLVKKAKLRAKQTKGGLWCEICGFDFKKIYGALGEDFIECHHTIPVSELQPNAKVKVSDIALVCSNCHRMVHRRRPWLNLSDLKNLLKGD